MTSRFWTFRLPFGLGLACALGFAWLVSAPATASAAACSPGFMSSLLAPQSASARPVEIGCDVTLPPRAVVARRLQFSGSQSSGVTLDCRGGVIDGQGLRGRTVLIRSVERNGTWDVPQGVTIRNCTINGDMRIQGLGANGQAALVRKSSADAGHTMRAQAAAPRNILVEGVTFSGAGGIPFYLAPGVTGVTLRNSRFVGSSTSTFIYLDAESAGNTIADNSFSGRSERREVIAVDGSASNRITGNTFLDPLTGGIFLYRNCGEGGTVRHQLPRANLISGNRFRYDAPAANPAIWLGSRQGMSVYNSYCLTQPKMFLGGVFHDDGADGNTVIDNRIEGGNAGLIVDDGSGNHIANNR